MSIRHIHTVASQLVISTNKIYLDLTLDMKQHGRFSLTLLSKPFSEILESAAFAKVWSLNRMCNVGEKLERITGLKQLVKGIATNK